MTFPRRKKHIMTTGAYFVVAEIIKKIDDAEMRRLIADHFASEFNRRSPSFSPYDWERATGGKVAAGSAA